MGNGVASCVQLSFHASIKSRHLYVYLDDGLCCLQMVSSHSTNACMTDRRTGSLLEFGSDRSDDKERTLNKQRRNEIHQLTAMPLVHTPRPPQLTHNLEGGSVKSQQTDQSSSQSSTR